MEILFVILINTLVILVPTLIITGIIVGVDRFLNWRKEEK